MWQRVFITITLYASLRIILNLVFAYGERVYSRSVTYVGTVLTVVITTALSLFFFNQEKKKPKLVKGFKIAVAILFILMALLFIFSFTFSLFKV